MQMLHIVLNVKGIFRVIIGQLFVPLVLRYIEFIREKWSDTSKLTEKTKVDEAFECGEISPDTTE